MRPLKSTSGVIKDVSIVDGDSTLELLGVERPSSYVINEGFQEQTAHLPIDATPLLPYSRFPLASHLTAQRFQNH